MKLKPIQKRTWAEIDIDAVQENFNTIRQQIGNHTKVCCVIKANAYGHGALQLANVYEKSGADFLAVSNLEEALQLRHAEIHFPYSFLDTLIQSVLPI